MKATIAYLADTKTENYGKGLMLAAHKIGGMGFEAARLPMHVSLKQPFSIPDLNKIESFFDDYAKKLSPISLRLDSLDLFESKVFGYESGCLVMKIKPNDRLKNQQKELFKALEEGFGHCPAEHDEDYCFHMTVAIGGSPFGSYKMAYEKIKVLDYAGEALFDKLGLFYYDDDKIRPGSYFCYKSVKLSL